MKYIVTESSEGKKEIFIFSEEIHHDTMAEAISRIRNQTWGGWKRVERIPVSAGFVTNGKCHGHSETLGLGSHDEDTNLLNQIKHIQHKNMTIEIAGGILIIFAIAFFLIFGD